MKTLGFIIFCVVAAGFAGAALLMHVLSRAAWKTRVPTKLLVTEVEPFKDSDGDTFYRLHYLVLDGEHAGAKAVSLMNSNPALHEKHTHVDGWYNPDDGTAISRKGAKWERRMPFFLLGFAVFTLGVGTLFIILI